MTKARPGEQALSDEEVVRRVIAGERPLFELLMRRHNQRVYRAVRGLIRDEDEAEDVMQQAYVSAYLHLGEFRGGALFSTWVVRIAVNEALMRLRRSKPLVSLEGGSDTEDPMPYPTNAPSPEDTASNSELARVLEQVVDELPELYRVAFMLRDVEGLSTAETAQALATSEDVVKTRLHRARGMLREKLAQFAQAQLGATFPFHAPRCDRVVSKVMARISAD